MLKLSLKRRRQLLPYLFLVQPVTYYTMRSWVHGWYYNPIFPGQYFYTISKR